MLLVDMNGCLTGCLTDYDDPFLDGRMSGKYIRNSLVKHLKEFRILINQNLTFPITPL